MNYYLLFPSLFNNFNIKLEEYKLADSSTAKSEDVHCSWILFLMGLFPDPVQEVVPGAILICIDWA